MSDSPTSLRNEINEILCQKCNISQARDFQLNHGCDLVNGKDVFLVVGPGMGKTLVLCAPLLYAQKNKVSGIAIVVVPSKILTEQQASVFQSFGLRAIAINEDTLRDASYSRRDLFKELITGNDIRIAVMTPWMLQGERMRQILGDVILRHLLKWLFIDEVHLYHELDTSVWRAPYQALKFLRARLPSSTIWAAMTGTATISESHLIASGLGFSSGHYVDARYSVDRPNLKYITRFLQHPVSGFDFYDLSFLIPVDMKAAAEIATTLIFCQTIELGWRVMTFLEELIPAGVSNRANLIMPCNALFPQSYRTEFKSDMEAGLIRIGICTETCTYGLDIRNVRRVIILDEISSFAKMKQEFCRAGRDGLPAVIYTYAPAWVRHLPFYDIKTKQQKDDAARRDKLPKVIQDWFNASTPVGATDIPRCPREVDLEYNQESFVHRPRCCHFHDPNPELDSDQKTISKHLEKRPPKKKPLPRSDGTYSVLETQFRASLTNMLHSWRLRMWGSICPVDSDLPSNAFLPAHIIKRLTEKAHICVSYENFKAVVATWTYLDSHGTTLFLFLSEVLKGFKDIIKERESLDIEMAENADISELPCSNPTDPSGPLVPPVIVAPRVRLVMSSVKPESSSTSSTTAAATGSAINDTKLALSPSVKRPRKESVATGPKKRTRGGAKGKK